MATIKDIAKNLGISYSTVSLALNESPKVNEKTRQRIASEALRIGYHRNANARALVMRKTLRVGIIVPSILHPFFAEMLLAMQGALNDRGYDILICNTNLTPDLESHYLKLAVGGQVDGLIITSLDFKNPLLTQIIGEDFPVVFVNNRRPKTKAPFVGTDSALGGYLAGKHLLSLGHRRIAYFGALMSTDFNRKRYAGFRKALVEMGLSHDRALFYEGVFTFESGREMTRRLVEDDKGATAILASSDVLAVGALGYLQDRGFHVPNEYSLIGFDDAYFAGFPGINLTTVFQDKVRIGEVAVELLLHLLDNKSEPARSRKVLLAPHVVVRGTTSRVSA